MKVHYAVLIIVYMNLMRHRCRPFLIPSGECRLKTKSDRKRWQQKCFSFDNFCKQVNERGESTLKWCWMACDVRNWDHRQTIEKVNGSFNLFEGLRSCQLRTSSPDTTLASLKNESPVNNLINKLSPVSCFVYTKMYQINICNSS